MLPLVLALSLAAPPPAGPIAAGAVLTEEAQWAAVAASPRIVMRSGAAGVSTGVTLAVKGGIAYVLTAKHAIQETSLDREVQFFSKDSYPNPYLKLRAIEVTAAWDDPDLALLKVKVGPESLPSLPLAGPGTGKPSYPFKALSVGCTNGKEPTCRAETVIGKRPARRPSGRFAFFWEMESSPVQGRSGGPLLDDRGRVIGICAAGQGNRGYYTHADEILVGLKREGYSWLWPTER